MNTNNNGTDLSSQMQNAVESELTGTENQLPEQTGQSTETTEQQGSVATLQQELAAAREEAARYQKEARTHQASFTQARQQLSALTGFQQQADPVEQLAEQILKAGNLARDPEQARSLARIMHAQNAPLQQALQAQQLSIMNQNQIGSVMNNLYAKAPGVLNDPTTWQSIENNLRAQAFEYARAGQPWNAEEAQQFAEHLAAQEYGRKVLFGNGNNQQTQQTQQFSQMPVRSQFGPAPGFLGQRNQQQQKPEDTPEMKALQAQLDQKFNITKK